jgi:hypothetical protein
MFMRNEPTLDLETMVHYTLDEKHAGRTGHVQAGIISLPKEG